MREVGLLERMWLDHTRERRHVRLFIDASLELAFASMQCRGMQCSESSTVESTKRVTELTIGERASCYKSYWKQLVACAYLFTAFITRASDFRAYASRYTKQTWAKSSHCVVNWQNRLNMSSPFGRRHLSWQRAATEDRCLCAAREANRLRIECKAHQCMHLTKQLVSIFADLCASTEAPWFDDMNELRVGSFWGAFAIQINTAMTYVLIG